MILAVTYCSADKDERSGKIPAVERYLSSRIRAVYRASQLAGVSFRILSGRFGLLEADEPIPHYDHLLSAQEVNRHAELLTEQLGSLAPRYVVFFARSLAFDPNTTPYREAMQRACQTLNVFFGTYELPDGEIEPGEIATILQLRDVGPNEQR